MSSAATLLVLVTLVLTMLARVESLIHHLVISNDHRNIFKIESFGFVKGGTMQLDLADFHVKAPPTTSSSIWGKKATSKFTEREKEKLIEEIETGTRSRKLEQEILRELDANSKDVRYNVGFILRHATSESAAQQDLEKIIDRNECIFDKRNPNDIYIDLSDPGNWKKLSFVHVIDEEQEIGFYSLIFAHCNRKVDDGNGNKDKDVGSGTSSSIITKLESSSHYAKSFKLDVTFRNPGPDYLSAGDAPLPKLYFIFFLLYAGMMGLWMYVLGNKDSRKSTAFATPSVHRIHYVMLMLLTLKVLSLLFESIRYHYISLYGVSEGWSIVYYIFAGLKGIMMFTVILLIGSGYSLMKNYLSGHEKKVIYVVLILQVIDNIAMIILEETAPGSQFWLTWRDILHLVDVLCCLAILLPIVWSIRHLRYVLNIIFPSTSAIRIYFAVYGLFFVL
jgi:hypothetical protein